MGYLALLLGIVVNAAAFIGLRVIAARAAGVRGLKPVLAIDPAPWAGVPLGRRIVFTLAGPFGCYLAAVTFIALGYALGGEVIIDETSMRVKVAPNGPADVAGIRDGDQVLFVESTPIADWNTFKAEIGKRPAAEVRVVVRRGATEKLTFTPIVSAEGKIRVSPPTETRPLGVGSAIARGLVAPVQIDLAGARSLGRIFSTPEKAELVGPVAIAAEMRRDQPSWVTTTSRLLGGLSSYFLFVPFILALVFFPRAKRANQK